MASRKGTMPTLSASSVISQATSYVNNDLDGRRLCTDVMNSPVSMFNRHRR